MALLRVPTLYKHTDRRQWVLDTRDHGALRLGTLGAYREIVGYRQDPLETAKQIELRPAEDIQFTEHRLRSLLPGNVFIRRVNPDPSPLVKLGTGSQGTFGVLGDDAYIFCVSEREHATGFGDWKYAIRDANRFGEAVLHALWRRGVTALEFRLEKVTYDDSKQVQIRRAADLESISEDHMEVNAQDYFCKPLRFEPDAEWRYVFPSQDPPSAQYIMVECDSARLRECCDFLPLW